MTNSHQHKNIQTTEADQFDVLPLWATVRHGLIHLGQWGGRVLIGFIVPFVVLVLWHFLYKSQWLAEQILPSPQLVWQTFWELLGTGELSENLLISLQRIGWSVLLGGGIGLVVGFAIGLSRKAYDYLYPTFNLIAQFPVIGWIPLLLIFLGIEESLKIVAIALAVVVPVMVATYKSVLNVSSKLLEVAQVYEFSRWQTLSKVIIPAALPNIVGGLRQGVMQAWLALVFVELLASSEGIGYLIVWGRQLIQPDIVYMSIIVIGVVGYLLDSILQFIEQRFNRWQKQAF
ncbi:ABC transporter permease [Acinetobacter sp. NIPH 2699]|uniref:ABC transporter permease n=1 Tax=Acinetobacter sp. NIPH 2699 TaxID=2923433 RepID=UPI001F4A14F6|nr:ABC transporter permease [Acinetobacter sp. NIPH 2699]MCH7336273.1 ABC transporter permease [Acinetobacter sp. NIPH 2699]